MGKIRGKVDEESLKQMLGSLQEQQRGPKIQVRFSESIVLLRVVQMYWKSICGMGVDRVSRAGDVT